MHVRPLFNVGRQKNCPTWKRKNQNHTIKAEQKLLISVVVTAQSKVSFVYGPGAVGFLPWWDCCRIYMHPLQHGEGRNLLPECKRLALPYRAPAHRWLGGMVDYFLFSLIKIINKSRWKKPKYMIYYYKTKGRFLGPQRNFPNLMIFEQMQLMIKYYDFFLKKKRFLKKRWKLMAFNQNLLTITHETANYDEKNRKFSQKASCCCRVIVRARSSSLQCGTPKKLSHMEAQKSKSYYKSWAKITDISGSYRAV